VRNLLALAVVGGLAIAAPSGGAEHRFVNNEVRKDGTRQLTTLWDSETSWSDCSREIMAALEREVEASKSGTATRTAPKDLGNSGACKEGSLGELTQGTELEILSPTEACGVGSKERVGVEMSRVKVLSGKYASTIGCIRSDRVSPTRVP
jgi:hypothetical protein